MSLYRRKDSAVWWLKIAVNGQIIQRSTGTADKAFAEEYHDKLKSDLWQQSRLGVKPRYVWQDAVERYLSETQHKASQVSDIFHLKWLHAYLEDVELNDINRAMLDKITQAKKLEKVKNSTVNRTLEVVRAILRKAVNEWEWLDRAPSVRMLPEGVSRIRWLKQDEAKLLISCCPPHLAAMVVVSLETGLRKSNAAGLLWSQVDLVNRQLWIHADQAKSRKAIPVPLSVIAIKVITDQIGKHLTHVFSYKGKIIVNPNNSAFEKALKRAGITNFRWHDLRHTWASWLVQAGTPLHVLQELGGWQSIEMVKVYAHLAVQHLAAYVDKAASNRVVNLGDGYELATVQKQQRASN
jgi:integrase